MWTGVTGYAPGGCIRVFASDIQCVFIKDDRYVPCVDVHC